MKMKCPWCGRTVGAHVPKGGDGSAWRFSRHNAEPGRQGPTGGGNGNTCKGSGRLDCEYIGEPWKCGRCKDEGGFINSFGAIVECPDCKKTESKQVNEPEETHDAHGFQLASHKLKGRDDAWWYEENDGIHVVVEPTMTTMTERTKSVRIPWSSILKAAKRGGKI